MHNRGRAAPRARIMTAIGALSALVPLLLTGCAMLTPDVCPAIAYGTTAQITIANPQPGLTLEVCDGDGCVPGPPTEPVVIGSTEQPRDTNLMDLSGSSVDGWQARFMFGGEPKMGYRLTDEVGTVVAEGYVTVEWVRIDGSERCGGNRQAIVELPA